MQERIIIAEDDESIRRLLELTLSSHGYLPHSFALAEDALAYMEENPPDLAVFDIMMDGLDGIEAVRRLRQHPNPKLKSLPVIMLTAKETELDKIAGFDAGADDYLTKPFSVLELCARVRAVLRRVGDAREKEMSFAFTSATLSLDANTREVYRDGLALELTFKEFELLKFLMEHQHRAVSRAELLEVIWEDSYGGTRTVDIHIATLRHKLKDSASKHQYIKTVRGLGYRFVGGL